MRWRDREGSSNVIDRTGGGGGRRRGGRVLGGGGLGTVVLVLILYLLGMSPGEIFSLFTSNDAPTRTTQSVDDSTTRQRKEFVSVVLRDTEVVWTGILAQKGMKYEEPRLVLFQGEVSSACGFASATVGPFYCPGDQNLYLDLSFFDQLSHKLNAPGDFAQAYVIGHEVGHHIQNLQGTLAKVQRKKKSLSKKDANALQVRVELQADFYAGLWAHHAQKRFQMLEEGDIDEALRAASSIGDDTLQKKSRGYVVPDAFTHGTSEQRVRWFKKGFTTGEMDQGDTFSASRL